MRAPLHPAAPLYLLLARFPLHHMPRLSLFLSLSVFLCLFFFLLCLKLLLRGVAFFSPRLLSVCSSICRFSPENKRKRVRQMQPMTLSCRVKRWLLSSTTCLLKFKWGHVSLFYLLHDGCDAFDVNLEQITAKSADLAQNSPRAALFDQSAVGYKSLFYDCFIMVFTSVLIASSTKTFPPKGKARWLNIKLQMLFFLPFFDQRDMPDW